MPPLYVIQQGAKLRISNQRLLVETDREVHANVPLGHVNQVILYGNIGLTTPAIGALLHRAIDVVFLTQRGDYRGRLVGEITPHVPLRRAQYKRLEQSEFCLKIAKRFVYAKTEHQRALLLRHNRERKNPNIAEASERIRSAQIEISRKTELSSLLGLEGASTAAYFSGLRPLFDNQWKFEGRNRRPPRDPINVLLSFGYTIITQLAHSAIQTVGLDPYAGFLHQVAYNRPALGLDLVEEFRPVVDGIVLWCCNSGQITLDDFHIGNSTRPIILSEQGQKRFLRAYEQRMEQKFTHPLRGNKYPLRQCILEQARQIAECIKNSDPSYQGMGFR